MLTDAFSEGGTVAAEEPTCAPAATDDAHSRAARADTPEHDEIRRLRREADASRQLLSYVCHELRAPLHLARMGMSLVIDDAGLSPQCREDLSAADANLVRCAKLVAELMDGARIERGTIAVEPQPVDAGRLVRDVVGEVQCGPEALPARLTTCIATDLPRAYVDPERFRQVLTNLIDNALKFTTPGTVVAISARRCRRRPGWLEFAVVDRGPGVDARTCDQLFEPFHQAPTSQCRKGLGLGLYICRELVERHGGEIWVENGDAGGARFSFTLPCWSLPATLAI